MSRIVLVVGCLVVALVAGTALGATMAFRDLGATFRLGGDAGPSGLTIDVPPSAVNGGAGAQTDPNAVAPANSALISALRGGGFVIYLQHMPTLRSGDDAENLDPRDCTTQRNLSEEGRAQARALGDAFRARGIPVDLVLTSPLCRARETAELAFGKASLNPNLTVMDVLREDENTELRRETLRRLLAAQPAAGQNTVIVGHWQNLALATSVFQESEGEAAVFRPDGKGTAFLVARVAPGGWQAPE